MRFLSTGDDGPLITLSQPCCLNPLHPNGDAAKMPNGVEKQRDAGLTI
jgi:hypothetical protein